MKKKIAIFLILAAAVWGLWSVANKEHKRDRDVLHGNVDIREVNLGFRVSGRLSEVLRDEGDAVKAGEIVARLDDEPFVRAVNEAQGQVDSLQARLKWLEAGYRPEEIAQARATVHEREVTSANAKRVFDRQQELYGTRAVSIQDRDDAEARYREASARLVSAREQLGLMQIGYRAEEIAQAKGALNQAQAALASAQLRKEDTVLKAPSDGVVLTRAQEPGAIVASGTTVLTVDLKEPVWVRAYINEPDLGRIHPGMKVDVFTDSRPNQPYSGTIGYVSPRAEFTPKSVETAELRTSLVYRLRVVVSNPDEGLRQGMPVTVKLKPEGATAENTKK